MADEFVDAPREEFAASAAGHACRSEGGEGGDRPDDLVIALRQLTDVIRDLVARSPVSSEELLTADQLGELFRMSPRTIRDLAASGSIPHRRLGKHYRFSREDIAEVLRATRQIPRNRRSRPRAA